MRWRLTAQRLRSTPARAYRSIWTADGSPLLVHSRALRDATAESLGAHYVVRLGMRYGSPSIEKAQAELISEGVDPIIAFPLFPQFAESSTGSAVRKVLPPFGDWPIICTPGSRRAVWL